MVGQSRRAFLLAASGALAGAAAPLACGGDEGDTSTVSPAMQDDAVVANRLLHIERMSITAYTAALPFLSGESARQAITIRNQEREHARALRQAIVRLKGRIDPPRPLASYRFPAVRSEREALSFAHDLEARVIAGYLQAIGELSPGPLRRTVAAILTNEAQHETLLAQDLGRGTGARSAFVTGRRPAVGRPQR